jgi:DNA-directed RNA polymerase specialized sigma24 family protein
LTPQALRTPFYECYLKALVNIADYRAATARVWLIELLKMICVREILQSGDCKPEDADDPRSTATQARANDQTAVETPKPGSPHADTTVQTLVALLPLSLREAIVLNECIHLSYSDIADVTGTSASVVNERLARARTMLLDLGALSAYDGRGAVATGARELGHVNCSLA